MWGQPIGFTKGPPRMEISISGRRWGNWKVQCNRSSKLKYRKTEELLILYIALAVFNGVLAAIAFSQLVRIHMRNQQIGWTRQKVLHLMIGCSNLGYFLYFTSTLIATCKQWFCWFSVCGFILMAYPKVLLLAAFLLVLSFCYTLRAFCMAICLKKKQLLLQNHFNKNFAVPPLPTELVYRNHCICLPPNANLIIDATVKNKSETNFVTELYFQIEQAMRSESIRLKLLVDLFHEIVQEPFFDQLRTKEQLGYVVLCGWTHTCKVFGFYFIVQSSKYNPVHLQSRLENFIVGLEELLKGLDDDSFENYKGGLMAKLFEKDASLTCETYRLWTQILGEWYTFEYSKMAAEQLISIQKEDVTNFYKTYLHQSSPKCRRLTTRVWGCNTDLKEAEEAQPESEQVIEDLSAFKMSSKFYDGKRCQKVTPLNC